MSIKTSQFFDCVLTQRRIWVVDGVINQVIEAYMVSYMLWPHGDGEWGYYPEPDKEYYFADYPEVV